MPTFAKDI